LFSVQLVGVFQQRPAQSFQIGIGFLLRHVYQYEMLGSINGFLPVYLQQIVEYGYYDAPLESDARDNEVSGI
jgi:hypothetical protein